MAGEGEVVSWVAVHGHANRGPKSKSGWFLAEGGCHIWTGTRNQAGYGRIKYHGRLHLAHRLRYQLEVGPIPDGYELDHFACDNGSGGCCNPAHVRPVTRRENVLRGNSPIAAQVSQTHCKRGHPLSGDNLGPYELRRGERRCVACRTENRRRRDARKRGLSVDEARP